jgi:HEAT repeat protein/tetratricopeptide (TPR) repeat protein
VVRLRAILLAVAVAAPILAPAPAAAQDDWAVSRDPFDPKVIGQYKAVLAKNPGDKDALARLTRLYKKHRTLALLVGEYEKAVERDPKNAAALIVLGHLALADGKAEAAAAHYERALALRADDVDLLIALGDLDRRLGKPAEASARFARALPLATAKPRKKELLRALADLAIDAGDLPTAKRHLDAYLALDPGDLQSRLALGDAQQKAAQYDDAIATFRAAEAKLAGDPPRRVEVVARIGAALEAAGKDDLAIAEYDRAMAMVKRGYYLRAELTERIVEINRRRGTLPTLVERFEQATPAARRDHFDWDLLARLYEETGLQDKAIAAYKQAIKKSPWELETQRRLVKLLENAGREPEALAQYEAVIRVAPGEPRFQIELAERFWRRGEAKKALAMLERVQARFGGDPGVQSSLADLYVRWGKDDLALAAYQRLVQIEPGEASHLVDLGEQYFQKNDKKKALEIWKRIASDKRPESLAKLANVYADHDMLAEAIDLYGKAIKGNPKGVEEVYKARAAVYERQKSIDLAIADWDKVLELAPPSKANRPRRREARRQIVNLLKRAGGRRLDNRLAAADATWKRTPPDLEAGYFLVEGYLRNGDGARARATLEKLLVLEPDDLDAMDQLVKVYENARAYPAAIALLEKMLGKAPGRERELYNRISEYKTLLHQDDEAIRYAQRALDKSPNDPVAYQELAERYQELQKYDLAIAAYEKAIAIDPKAFRAHFALARLYRNKDALGDAARLYREVLKRASDDEMILKAGREAIGLEELTGTLGGLEKMLAPLAFTYAHKPVFRRMLVELYERYVPALVAARAQGGGERAKADAALAEVGAHGLKPLLDALGDDGDPVQQRIAIAVLGHLGNRGAAAPLIRIATAPVETGKKRAGGLIPTLDWDVRVEALVAAGRLGDARTIPQLVALTSHAEVAMREAAVFALGVTAEPQATAPLVAAVDDRRGTVQTLACLGLAATGDKRAVAAAIRVLADPERADATRAACAFALGALGDPSAVSPLAAALGDGQGEAQRLAAWALGRLGDPRALPALLTGYFATRDGVRDAITWALPRVVGAGAPPAPPAGAPLADYPLRNGKFDEAAAIATLAGTLETGRLEPRLIVGHDRDLAAGIQVALRTHRDQVLRVLADLDARPVGLGLGPLTAGLDGAPTAERAAIEPALERIGAAIAGELAALSRHRDPAVRSRALSVLAKVGGDAAADAVGKALADPEPSVRQAATRAIAVLAEKPGGGALTSKLVAQLDAPGWQDRVAAATALGRLGGKAAIAGLQGRLARDDKAFVRAAAAHALGRLRAEGALEPLVRAATAGSEPVRDVRLAAIEALHALGGAAARRALELIGRTDPEPAVRAAAMRKK